MKRSLTSSVILAVAFFGLSLGASPPQGEDERARAGLELVLKRDYPGAERFLQQVLQEDPQGLLGYFGMMALAQLRNFENYDFRFEPLYRKEAEVGRKKALETCREAGASAWDLLLAGGILGVSGFQKAHHHRWLGALRDADKAIEALKKAHRLDPTMADPLLGLGLYEYWRSSFTRFLRFLPFFPDRRGEGRAKVLKAATEGTFIAPAAGIALAFIDHHRRRHPEVLALTVSWLRRYPNNLIVRMLEGETYLALKQYPQAIDDFAKILAVDPSITKSYLFLGLAFAAEGKDKETARKYLADYLAIEPEAPARWRKSAEEALKKLPPG